MNPKPNHTTPEDHIPSSSRPLSRLADLTGQQLEQIDRWLDEGTSIRRIVDLCRTEFQVEIPHMTIARYSKRSTARRLLLRDLADSADVAAEISHYAATGVAALSPVTIEILEKQAFDLALTFTQSGDSGDLDDLEQVWKLIHKAKESAIRVRLAAVQERKCELRNRELEWKKSQPNFGRRSRANNPPAESESAECEPASPISAEELFIQQFSPSISQAGQNA